jgi:isocitrate dehydrogenase (NAD+)
MFEAIHGSAPRMVTEGRAQYADPCSMIRAAAMLLSHIGFTEKGKNLEMALDITGQYEKRILITGRATGVTGEVFTDYVMEWVKNPKLQQTWEGYVKG